MNNTTLECFISLTNPLTTFIFQICVRGPNVMKGYYKQREVTAQIIDSDGWLHTGDIGMILPNGTLRIIDRKMVCITHKYVTPASCCIMPSINITLSNQET